MEYENAANSDKHYYYLLTPNRNLMGGSETCKIVTIINRLIQSGVKRIVLDLHKARLINARGIGCLVGIHSQLLETGGTLILINVSEITQRIFNLTKVSSLFHIIDSDELAREFYSQDPVTITYIYDHPSYKEGVKVKAYR